MKLIVSRPGYPAFRPEFMDAAYALGEIRLVDVLDTCGWHHGAAFEERGLCGDLAAAGVLVYVSANGSDLYLAPRCERHAGPTRAELDRNGEPYLILPARHVAQGPAAALTELEARAAWGDR